MKNDAKSFLLFLVFNLLPSKFPSKSFNSLLFQAPIDDDPFGDLDEDLHEMMRLPDDQVSSFAQESTPPRPSTSTYTPPVQVANPPLATALISGETVQERIERNRRLALERLEVRRLSALSSSQTTSPGWF